MTSASGCCGRANETWDSITADLYDAGETAGLPAEALLASLGCGNPTALAEASAGASNVEFLKGHIESIPLPSNTVDVVISNCVINLSGDKRRVLEEAFRVLKPGGRFAVSDVIVRDGLPQPAKDSMAMWTGCVAGALEEQEFLALLSDVGIENPSIEPTRVYTRDEAAALLAGTGLDACLASEVEEKIMSGFVRASRP